MAIGYTELDFINGGAPALNATNLNHIDEALKDACDLLDAETVAGRALATAANASAQRALLNVEDGADVTANNAPRAHTASHKHGGTDEIATATPAPNAIPKADGSGKLDGWISDSAVGTKGKVALAADGGTTAGTVVQGNDSRLQSAIATWTPVPKFGGVNDDGTFVISQNRMTRAGKKYTYDARIIWSAKGTKTGEFSMSGIVQAAATSGVPAGWIACDAGMSGLTAGAAIVSVVTTLNVTFRKHVSGGLDIALTDANFTNASDIRIHIEFIAS